MPFDEAALLVDRYDGLLVLVSELECDGMSSGRSGGVPRRNDMLCEGDSWTS